MEPTLANFADFFTDAYVMIAEDDLVAVLDHWGGTSAASGHEAHVAGIDIYRIENGKLGDFYLLYSTLSWSQQLGNVPSEEEVPLEQPWDVELGATSSTPDEHKLVLIRLLEATNEANVDLLDEVYTDDAVIHQVSSRTQLDGLEAIKESWSAYLAENPEYRMASGYVIAEGDLVVMHGDIFNALENGERYRVYVGMLFRFEDGRIAEQWEIWDAQTLFQLSAE